MGQNPNFFAAAQDGVEIEVDFEGDAVRIGRQEFAFRLSSMEKRLYRIGGITPAFLQFGKAMFDELSGKGQAVAKPKGAGKMKEVLIGDAATQW
jgi:hypothetical protein